MATRRSLGVLVVVLGILLAGCLSGGFGGTNAVGGSDEPNSTTTTTTPPTTTPPTTTPPTATLTATPTETRAVPIETYDTREALVENAPFDVPEPAVPQEFAFDSGIVQKLENTTRVSLAYHFVVDENANDDEEGELRNVLSVGKFEGDALNRSQGESVTVGDREARYVQDEDGRRTLLWHCAGYTYRVSVQSYGDEFGEDDLFAVAESVGCDSLEDEGA